MCVEAESIGLRDIAAGLFAWSRPNDRKIGTGQAQVVAQSELGVQKEEPPLEWEAPSGCNTGPWVPADTVLRGLASRKVQ